MVSQYLWLYEQHCLDQMEKKAGIIIYHISSIAIITDYQRTRAIYISDRHLNHNHLNRLVISMVWVVGSNFYNSQYSLGNHYKYMQIITTMIILLKPYSRESVFYFIIFLPRIVITTELIGIYSLARIIWYDMHFSLCCWSVTICECTNK